MQFIKKIREFFASPSTEAKFAGEYSMEKTWSQERFDDLSAQRNLFVAVSVIALLAVSVLVFSAIKLIGAKEIVPFVVQIDDDSGAVTIVNPMGMESITAHDALARYFVKKYISARETYNSVDFDTSARRFIKLTSEQSVYGNFIRFINDPANDPRRKYGINNSTYIKTKSWSKLDGMKYLCRFSVNETAGDMRSFDKIAIVQISYVQMNLTAEEQDINPVGFQVTGYRVDDDNS